MLVVSVCFVLVRVRVRVLVLVLASVARLAVLVRAVADEAWGNVGMEQLVAAGRQHGVSAVVGIVVAVAIQDSGPD